MSPLGVLAFTEDDGYILDTTRSFRSGMPRKLSAELEKGVSAITCCAIGTGGNFFCAWRNVVGRELCLSELGSYPRLATDLADEDSQKKFEPNKFHVSLGPNSSYYFNNTAFGQNADKLDVKLDRHLTSRLTSDGHWDRDPIHVTLGCDGSYVSVGRDGDLLWDLKGGYASLETILQEATTGVGNVTLSPFHNDRYYIIFKDGREYWHEPSS